MRTRTRTTDRRPTRRWSSGRMRGLFIHTVVYAVVNTLLVGIWLLTTGSTDELSNVQNDAVYSVQHGFWPLIVAVAWGGALVIHAAVVVGSALPGSRKKQLRKA